MIHIRQFLHHRNHQHTLYWSSHSSTCKSWNFQHSSLWRDEVFGAPVIVTLHSFQKYSNKPPIWVICLLSLASNKQLKYIVKAGASNQHHALHVTAPLKHVRYFTSSNMYIVRCFIQISLCHIKCNHLWAVEHSVEKRQIRETARLRMKQLRISA